MLIRTKATTINTSTEHPPRVNGSRSLAAAVLSVAVALWASAAFAGTQVSVHGDRARVRLEVGNAPLSEVLSALESAFSIQHRTLVPLDQPISGTYRGSLRKVLSRLLDGFSYYVVDTAGGTMEVTVVGRAGDLPAAVVAATKVENKFPKLVVPPPTAAQVLAERQRAHHRRPPP